MFMTINIYNNKLNKKVSEIKIYITYIYLNMFVPNKYRVKQNILGNIVGKDNV